MTGLINAHERDMSLYLYVDNCTHLEKFWHDNAHRNHDNMMQWFSPSLTRPLNTLFRNSILLLWHRGSVFWHNCVFLTIGLIEINLNLVGFHFASTTHVMFSFYVSVHFRKIMYPIAKPTNLSTEGEVAKCSPNLGKNSGKATMKTALVEAIVKSVKSVIKTSRG